MERPNLLTVSRALFAGEQVTCQNIESLKGHCFEKCRTWADKTWAKPLLLFKVLCSEAEGGIKIGDFRTPAISKPVGANRRVELEPGYAGRGLQSRWIDRLFFYSRAPGNPELKSVQDRPKGLTIEGTYDDSAHHILSVVRIPVAVDLTVRNRRGVVETIT